MAGPGLAVQRLLRVKTDTALQVIADKTRNFIPMYEATLSAILIPNLKVDSPALLFNREKVDLLALLGQRAKEDK